MPTGWCGQLGWGGGEGTCMSMLSAIIRSRATPVAIWLELEQRQRWWGRRNAARRWSLQRQQGADCNLLADRLQR